MPAAWEREANYNLRRKHDAGLTPYQDVSKWRRRAWIAIVIAVGEGLVLLSLLRSIH